MPHSRLAQLLQQHVRSVIHSEDREKGPRQSPTPCQTAALSRREFLQKLGMTGAAVLPLWSTVCTAAKVKPSARIVVVGAGLAGLTCAYRLRQAGYQASVYEASTRLGGRCHTLRDFFDHDQVIERGGELIDQSHTAIRHLAKELDLTLDNQLQAESSGTEPAYFFDGEVYSYRQATADIKQIWQKLHRDLSQAGYPTLYHQYTQRGWELDHLSVSDWIQQTVPGGLNSRLGKLLDVAYNIEYGAESEDQSALNLLYLLGYSGQGQFRIFGPSNEKYHVRGGNDQIPERLGQALQDQVILDAELTGISLRSDGSYALLFENDQTTREVLADHIVLTVPFSILRTSVNLANAGFRAEKLTAIHQLGMGKNTKLQLQFHNRIWRSQGNNGDSFADTGYQATWEVTRAQPGRPGILVNYTGGLTAAGMNVGSVAQRAELFLRQVEPLLPGLANQWNTKATLDHWPEHPWTRGSYSFWRVGQYTQFAGIESERERNCHFAGEHTSIDSQGYLNGAVETGERAALEILADLGAKPGRA